MKLFTYSLVLLSAFVVNSCKNDLKLTAPYKEIPSIYAVLNVSDKTQTVRINKVFLGEGNANQMAQVSDSINYPAGELTVTLERTNEYGAADVASTNGNKTITFTESEITAKPGAFSQTQRVYVTSEKLIANGTYVLKVKNNKTGNVFTAKAGAIDSLNAFYGGRPFNRYVYPYGLPIPPLEEFIDYASIDIGTIRFPPLGANNHPNGAIYQMTIRMHFFDSLGNGQKNYDYVDYDFTTKNVKDVEKQGGQDYIKYQFKKDELFVALGVGLSKKNLNNKITGRKLYKIQYFVYSASQEYADYMQYVTPSLSIAQNKPLYSNFDNQAALGIFTFRTRSSINKEPATAFVNEFAYNSNTCAYQFVASNGYKPGCNH